MERLGSIANHLAVSSSWEALANYRQMSVIDAKFLRKLYFLDYEKDMLRFEQLILNNPVFKYDPSL